MKNTAILLFFLCLMGCNPTEKIVTQYDIEQFFENTSIDGGFFSEDGSRLLFSSDESGIYNLFEILLADGSKKQLTHSSEESLYALAYVPGSKDVLYSADKGGNEITHIYLLQESGEVQDLTPGEAEKTLFMGWSASKDYAYYLSNKRDERFFDLYKMKTGEWKAELVFQNETGMSISDWSWDESYIVLTQAVTSSENQLFLYNRTTEEMTEISRKDASGIYLTSNFSKDDRHLVYQTDVGKEFTYLESYEISSGERKIIFETDWSVAYSFVSDQETYRVIAINEDGKNDILILNNQTGAKVDFPDIPDGNISSVEFSDSEKQVCLTVSTSRAPSNLYVYNLESGELKKITQTINPEIDSNDLVSAEVIRYPSFDGLEIPAIYYKPNIASPSNKVPALVWVHGGPGGQSRVGYSELIQYLVNHGYAILAVNNRGSSGYGKTFFKMDDQRHGEEDRKDCIWGKQWLQKQGYIDPDKIGILGGSYGGYMVMAAMAFSPDEFEVGVNLFGVTNWLRTLKSIPPFWEAFRDALYAEMGDPFTKDSLRLYNYSPLFHAHQVKNPVIVLQGANDPRVLQIESDEIVAALKENNVSVEYVVFPDEGHGFVKKENKIHAYRQIKLFLDKYLKKEAP